MKVISADALENVFRSLDIRPDRIPPNYAAEVNSLPPVFRPTPDFFDKDYYDTPETKSGYNGYNHDSRWDPVADEIILRYVPESVLDFGGAKGFLVDALLRKEVPAYCADVSEYALKCAPERVKPRTILLPGNGHIPLPSKSVDLCVSRDVLEHVPEPILDATLKEILRVSKRQLLNIHGANTPEEHEIARNADVSHVSIHSEEWWIRRLQKVGFEGTLAVVTPHNKSPLACQKDARNAELAMTSAK